MSIVSIQNSINRLDKEIAQLEKKMTDELKKEAEKNKKIADAQKSISSTKSLSTIKSKQQQIETLTKDLVNCSKKKAEINKKISDNRSKLITLNQQLQKEKIAEERKEKRKQEEIRESYEKRIDEVTQQIQESSTLQVQRKNQDVKEIDEVKYDVFISHASEDKESFVRELAETLINNYGIKVWYDELSIKWGDSLRIAIDKGLNNSKYGIVVISKSFIKKGWTNYELDALFQNEMTNGKIILPIWHDITKDEVQKFSPTLAGRKALSTAMFTIDEIAEELQQILDIGEKQ